MYSVDGKIHKWLTLMKNIPKKNYKDKKFILHNCPTIEERVKDISEYISILDAKEAFGLCSLSYTHELLYQGYRKIGKKEYIREER